MKKLFFLFFLSAATHATAGCGGVCIFASQNQNYYAVHDTVQLSQGNAVLYANYNSCCDALFGNVTLVWCRNGIPFDTTSGGTLVGTGMYSQQLSVSQPGVYTVFFINFVYPNNPSYACGTVTVTEHSGPTLTSTEVIDASLQGILVYPNPAVDNVTITSENNIIVVKVFSQNGMEVFSSEGNSESNSMNMDVSGYAPGIYFIEVKTGKGTERRKLVRL